MERWTLTPKEVAEKLGMSERTVHLWCQRGELPAFKVGNRWLIDAQALRNWIADRSGAPASLVGRATLSSHAIGY